MKIWAFGHILKIRAEVLWDFIVAGSGNGVGVGQWQSICVSVWKPKQDFRYPLSLSILYHCLHCLDGLAKQSTLSVSSPPLPQFPELR